MNLQVRLGIVFLVCVYSGFLLGCSVLTPPTPTPTPAPTNTPTVVPSNTPTRPAPTATQGTGLPPAIAISLNRTQQLKSVRFEFESGITSVKDGKTTEIPGLVLKGEDSTLNRHVTLTGTTRDTNELITYEVIVIGDKLYIKGLTGQAGVDPNQWYQLPEQMQATIRNLPTAGGLVASFNPEEFAKARFQKEGAEFIDDQDCSIWSAQDPDLAQTLMGVTADSQLKQQLGEIDKTEFKVWTCSDGFIHLMTGQVVGHDASNKANTTTVTLRFHMTDFDQALKIEPPTDAKLFQPPTPRPTSCATASPTPAAEGTSPAGSETPTAGTSETPSAATTASTSETPFAATTETPTSEATATSTP